MKIAFAFAGIAAAWYLYRKYHNSSNRGTPAAGVLGVRPGDIPDSFNPSDPTLQEQLDSGEIVPFVQ